VATRWLAIDRFVRGAAGQTVIGRIRALIKGRSPATYTSDPPSEWPLLAHLRRLRDVSNRGEAVSPDRDGARDQTWAGRWRVNGRVEVNPGRKRRPKHSLFTEVTATPQVVDTVAV
jgi:hypothetical protein